MTEPTPSSSGEPPIDPPVEPKPAEPGKEPAPAEPAKEPTDKTALGPKDAEPASEAGAPEAYDIKPIEGREFDKEAFDAVAPELKEAGIDNDTANKLVGAYAEKVLPIIEARYAKQAEEASQLATATLKADWLAEAKKDEEIGGAKWDETIHIAGAVFDKVGLEASNPFRQILEDSGLGNHPDALRFMRRLGTMLGEDKFERGDGNHTPADLPIHDRIYGLPTKADG